MPVWLDVSDVIYFHNETVDEHGGLPGSPDQGALESTITRPRNLVAYQEAATIFELAAAYGFGFARNHCFPDGNKRLALISIDVFLQINGHELVAEEADAVLTIQEVASGDLTESELAAWIAENSKPYDLNAS